MMARRLLLVGFAAALPMAFGCSSSVDDPTPSFACTGGAAAANTVTMVCGGGNDTTQQVDVVIDGQDLPELKLNGLDFNVMYDGLSLTLMSEDHSAASQLFPGALVSVAVPPSTEPNTVSGYSGYKDVVVGIHMTGNALAPIVVGQHVVLSLTFQRAAGTTFTAPVLFNPDRTKVATPTSAGTAFADGLSLSYLYR